MIMPKCPGIQSPVRPTMALALCRQCLHYRYMAEGMEPKARRSGGEAWQCENHKPMEPAK